MDFYLKVDPEAEGEDLRAKAYDYLSMFYKENDRYAHRHEELREKSSFMLHTIQGG